MTWPFENDTSAIVKKLADRSMKADKRRNAFIIITIAFAVSLMMVLALYNLGTDRENRLYLQGRYQSSFINSTSTVFEKLEHNNQIESVGKEAAMGTSRINDYTLDVYYRDQNALELKGVTDLLGKMPEAENEIIVEQSYLEHLGLPVQLDQTVTLDMPFGENQTYHVCGIIQSRNASRIYQVIVSNGLYSRYVIVVCFSLINLVNTTITNFLSRRQEIGMLQAIGLSKKQLIKMLCYEGLMYSVFATLVTLVLGTGLGFLSVQVVVKTMNPYFYYSFPWLIVLIYLAILLIVQFTLISYTTGNLKKQSLVEQIRTME